MKKYLFIVLVSAHFRNIVATRVEEQIEKVRSYGIFRGSFARTQTTI